MARIVQEIKERRPLTINCRLLLLCNLALGLALLHLLPPFHLPSLSFSSDLQSGKVKAGRSRFQFLQAIQKSTNCAKYASTHPHDCPPALIVFCESAKEEWNCLKINLPGCHPNNATCRHDLRTRDPKLRRWCCQGPPPGVVAPQMEFIRCQRGSRVKRVGPEKPVVTFGCVRNSSQIQTPGRAMDQVTFIFVQLHL